MKRTPWLTFMALFVAGIGIGFLVGNGLRGNSRDRMEVVQPLPKEPETERAPQSTGDAGPADAFPGGYRSLAEALADIPIPETKAGAGKIKGQVRTGDGSPLEGVTIRAERTWLSKSRTRDLKARGGPPEEKDLEAEVREIAAKSRWRRATSRDAVTDGTGSFVLSGLVDAPYKIQAFKKGFEIRRIRPRRGDEVKPGDTVEFMANVLVDIRIEVLFPDGSTPDRAWIDISDRPNYRRTESWFPEDPVIRLTAGKYKLRAVAGEDDEFRSKGKSLTVTGRGDAASITFRLEPQRGIKGKVVCPPGLRIGEIWVRALRLDSDSPPDPKRLLGEGKFTQVHRRDGYAFSFPDMARGAYLVGAIMDRKVAASSTAAVAEGMTHVDLVLPQPAPEEYLVLRVYDPKGKILTDVDIETGYRSRDHTYPRKATVIAREDGSFLVKRYEFEGWEEKGRKGGTFFIGVESGKYGKKEVEYTPGETSEITVRFQEAAFLEVTVAGYPESEYVGRIKLTLEPKEGVKSPRPLTIDSASPFGEEEEKIDADGKQTLGPVEPGPYEIVLHIRVKPRNVQPNTCPVRRIPVTLLPGKNEASVEIPALYSLTVIASPQKRRASVVLSPFPKTDGSRNRMEDLGKDGKVVFKFLPAGDYKVMLWMRGQAGLAFARVPAQSMVRIERKPINAFEVTRVVPGSHMDEKGFREGDVIIGMDGVEFRDMGHMYGLVLGAGSKDQVTLIVLREGVRLEIPVDPKKALALDEAMERNFKPTCR